MHAIIFGYDPPNQKFQKNTKKGYPLFTSTKIDNLWKKGFHSIAEANEKTAYYIASYALKGKRKTIPNPDTGELIEVADTMNVSTKPAIGLTYLKKNMQQLVDSGGILPRYYVKKLEELNIDLYDQYVQKLDCSLKTRSTGERYAKFIISNQKTHLSDTAFRETGTTDLEDTERKFRERYLKQDRDNYVSLIKGAGK